MTTPSREEAPERVWLLGYCDVSCTWAADPDPDGQHSDQVEYLRADLANREPSEGDVASEREACAAIADELANVLPVGMAPDLCNKVERAMARTIARLIRARKTP